MLAAEALTWDGVVEFLQRARIGRLLFEGALDNEEGPAPPEFLKLSSPVYLDADIGLLRIGLVNDSYLSFRVVDSPTWEDFDESEKDNVGVIDLSRFYFGDTNDIVCL